MAPVPVCRSCVLPAFLFVSACLRASVLLLPHASPRALRVGCAKAVMCPDARLPDQDRDGENALHKTARAGCGKLVSLLLGPEESTEVKSASNITGLTTCNVKGLLPWQLATDPEVRALLRPELSGSQQTL